MRSHPFSRIPAAVLAGALAATTFTACGKDDSGSGS